METERVDGHVLQVGGRDIGRSVQERTRTAWRASATSLKLPDLALLACHRGRWSVYKPMLLRRNADDKRLTADELSPSGRTSAVRFVMHIGNVLTHGLFADFGEVSNLRMMCGKFQLVAQHVGTESEYGPQRRLPEGRVIMTSASLRTDRLGFDNVKDCGRRTRQGSIADTAMWRASRLTEGSSRSGMVRAAVTNNWTCFSRGWNWSGVAEGSSSMLP